MIKALLFDMDGVLVDTTSANFEAYKQACAEEDIVISYDEYVKQLGRSWKESIPLFARTADSATVKRIHDRKNVLYQETVSHTKLIPHIMALLTVIHKRYKTALVTGASVDATELVLSHHNLKQYFDVILTSKEYTKGKPDPECFLLAAKRLGVKPNECLVFEDSDTGFAAAANAGMLYLDVGGGTP